MLMLPDYRVRQRDFLLEISRAITAQLDLSEVLKRVLNASVIMLSGQMGLIALKGNDDLFSVRAVTGISTDKIEMLDEHLHQISAIIAAGSDPETFNERLNIMTAKIDRKLRQWIALPMIFADELLGLMIVFRNYRSSATPNDMQVLQSFADQAAIAVNNAQLYEKIDHERKRLAAILEHSADGVMILDANLRIIRFNKALERMTGYSAIDVIGSHQDEVLIWDKLEDGDLQSAIDDGWPLTTDATGTSMNPLYVEGDLRRLDDLTISLAITYAPMFNGDGKLTNIIANVRDITNFRKAQEMQNTFISVISHELKTPVAIIKGYAATLRRPDATWDAETIQDTLAVVEDEADRLDVLIQNLLTASKLQAQREISLEIDDVRLDKLAEKSVERLRSQTSQHQLVLHFPEHFPEVTGDEARLLQVLDNLINNAIKYSPNGGEIKITGSYDAEYVTIAIQDHGVGISKHDQERIFDRFFRVDGKLSRKTQGTGLGLYLSKAIIDAHNGSIHVESQPGRGSTFYLTLPR